MPDIHIEDAHNNSTDADAQFLQAIPNSKKREQLLKESFLLIMELSDEQITAIFERMMSENEQKP